jgi:hypothetical protein
MGVPYEVVCNCGQTVRGERQARHQVVSCPGCGDRVFVLPTSPLALPARLPVERPALPRRWWRAPLLAAAASLVVLLVVFATLWPFLGRPERRGGNDETTEEGALARQVEAGRHALRQGKFHVAQRLLAEALERRLQEPDSLPAADSRRLAQWHREADLLARLLPVSLEEVARQARLVRDPGEWNLQMADYRRHSVVFDDVVRRDPDNRPSLLTYVVYVDNESVRLALEDLTLLSTLPLDDRPRLLFGARLRNCEREEGGGWVIRFEPDSGVLLTERDAAAIALAGRLDRALEQTLARQQRWLDEQAGAAPR